MPEQTPAKRERVVASSRAGHATAGLRYAELRCKTNFSFLEGASHPDELVARAAELGYAALAVTDRNSLAGVVQAHVAAKEAGLRLIVGAEITPIDAPPVVLLATDRAAYGRLARLITLGRRRAPKGECHLTFDDVATHAAGLIAAVIDSPSRNDHRQTLETLKSVARPESAKGVGVVSPPATPFADSGRATLLLPSKQGESPGTQYSVLSTQYSALSAPLTYRSTRISQSATDHSPTHLLTTHSFLPCYRDAFGDRCYALAELHRGPDDARRLAELVEAARQARVPIVAANDVHYHVPARRELHDVLTAIRINCTVAEAIDRLFPNGERHLKSADELASLVAAGDELGDVWRDATRRTVEVAERCRFSLDELRYEYPEELSPPGMTPLEYLTRLTWSGARERYPDGVPDKVRRLVEHELQLITELRYEAYFLTVWDLVRFARSRGILCQGRGSAANSAVCFCLGVTSVDPERIDVLFERFISRERNEAPDIDVDFEHERREEVLQYLYDKYGRERAGITAEVITYRPRSAVRDVGKALGLSLDRVDAMAKNLEGYGSGDDLESRGREVGLESQSLVVQQWLRLTREIIGFPRHLSQHVGGMVITRGPLCELVPIENAAMPDRTVIEWDKDDLDALGILKVDCLALGMLTAIHKCFDLVERHAVAPSSPTASVCPSRARSESSSGVSGCGITESGAAYSARRLAACAVRNRRLTLADVPAEDPAVYAMIDRADTVGVFQIESRAQMSMLPRLRPRCFYDLVIEVAIVRPGPIQGQMVHPYLRRRDGLEAVEYPSDAVRAVLEKTLGVPLFQEQAMRLAVVAAGFTPGDADKLRRAMGAWRRPGIIEMFRTKFMTGMAANGYSAEFAERLFRQIQGFGEYGFPESHAASFALLVYVSAWLKRYFPAAFTASLLNSQPMGFYAPAQLIRDAREHGVEVRPVDVNASEWDCTLESGESSHHAPRDESGFHHAERDGYVLRLGLRMIRGLARSHADRIVAARGDRPFESLDDFTRRTGLSQSVLVRLTKADAFGSLRLNRRAALWHALAHEEELPLFRGVAPDEPPVALPKMEMHTEVVADYRTTGLSLKAHPLALVRSTLDQMRAVRAAELAKLPTGRHVRVAGLVLVRQRPSTAKGITFVTLEDETGVANLIVHPEIWDRHHRTACHAQCLFAHGRLERQGEVIHVITARLEDLSSLLTGLASASHDFR